MDRVSGLEELRTLIAAGTYGPIKAFLIANKHNLELVRFIRSGILYVRKTEIVSGKLSSFKDLSLECDAAMAGKMKEPADIKESLALIRIFNGAVFDRAFGLSEINFIEVLIALGFDVNINSDGIYENRFYTIFCEMLMLDADQAYFSEMLKVLLPTLSAREMYVPDECGSRVDSVLFVQFVLRIIGKDKDKYKLIERFDGDLLFNMSKNILDIIVDCKLHYLLDGESSSSETALDLFIVFACDSIRSSNETEKIFSLRIIGMLLEYKFLLVKLTDNIDALIKIINDNKEFFLKTMTPVVIEEFLQFLALSSKMRENSGDASLERHTSDGCSALVAGVLSGALEGDAVDDFSRQPWPVLVGEVRGSVVPDRVVVDNAQRRSLRLT